MNTQRVSTFMAILMAVALLCPVAQAQEEAAVDLQALLRVALGTNETIEQAQADIRYSKLLRRAAWTALLPSATLQGTFTRNDNEIQFPFGETDAGDPIMITFQNTYDYNLNLVVGSPIYMGGRLYKTVEQSGINIGINELQLTKSQKDLIFNVSMAYAHAIKAKRNQQIRREDLKLSREQLNQIKTFFEAGETVRASVLRAEAQVAGAEGLLIQAENEYRKALEDLSVLVPLPENVELEELPSFAEPMKDLTELVDEAFDTRVELDVIEKQLAINQLEIEKAFGEKFPELSWNFIYTKQRAGFPTDRFWKVNLNLTWRIWDSGASTVKKAQQETERLRIRLNRQLLKKQIRNEVEKARLDLETIEKALSAANRQLEAARSAYEDMQRVYKAGEATDLDVQDARRQFIDAQLSKSNLETDKTMAIIRLRHAKGDIPVKVAGGVNNEIN
jgi:outer membrane protein